MNARKNRRYLPAEARRNCQLAAMVTQAEIEAVYTIANEKGMSASSWLRRLVRDAITAETTEKE